MKRLSEIVRPLNLLEIHGDLKRPIRGIAYDSREVRPGFLFAALPGEHVDGHDYVEAALEQGAAAVLHSRPLASYRPPAAYLRVEDSRQALSPLSASFFGRPSDRLRVIGVTGTDGKSTTVWIIQQLLELLGEPSGFLSTVLIQTADRVEKNRFRQSTPEAPEIQGFLAEMVRRRKRWAVVEATSHGLSERTGRLADVSFDTAVLTNVTHEHLEFHGSFERYRSDKANLFRALGRPGPKSFPRFAVINLDDSSSAFFSRVSPAPALTYSMRDPAADLSARIVRTDLEGTDLRLRAGGREVEARLNLAGPVNVENCLAALLAISSGLSIPALDLAPRLPFLKGVKGRLELIQEGQPFQAVVDYAHTPEAFRRLFPFLKKHTPGSLVVVFGSAGERDTTKRPLQGEAASRSCDRVILADEDPRGEDPVKILEEIAAGCQSLERGKSLFLEPDRRRAIRLALSLARPGDTVAFLGKGHEESIIYSSGPRAWDEAAEVRRALRALKEKQ